MVFIAGFNLEKEANSALSQSTKSVESRLAHEWHEWSRISQFVFIREIIWKFFARLVNNLEMTDIFIKIIFLLPPDRSIIQKNTIVA